jgi:hypothetical protein
MSDYPSLSDVIDALRRLSPPRGSDRAKARDKLLDRLEALRALLPGLDVQRSRSFSELMKRSVILDLVDVKDVALPALFGLLVTLMREVYRAAGERGITRMLVLEEAHLVLGGQVDRRTSDIKESTPSGVLRDLRKTGACGVVVSQLIGDVARGVLGNLGSIICFRQSHQHCVRQAAAALTVKYRQQEEEIARLPNRHAIARLSRYPDPVYLVVRDARALFPADSRPPSREEARERSRPILEAIPYVKKCEAPAAVQVGAADADKTAAPGRERAWPAGEPKAEDGLPAAEARVYARIAAQPWELLDDRKDALGLDREAEGQARARLDDRGLITFAGKVGAKRRLFELTARGRDFARSRGLAVFEQGKGSTAHGCIIRYAEISLGRHSPAFRFQRVGASSTLGGVQSDLLLLLPSGGRVPIQACYRNQPTYEADALLRLHRLALLEPGDADKVDFVLAVCANRRHKAALERALMARNGGRLPGRLVLLDFDAIVDPGFDWAAVFEISI